MKKYLFPTVTIVCLLLGFLIGNAVSNKVNAQRFYIQNGQLVIYHNGQKINALGQTIK